MTKELHPFPFNINFIDSETNEELLKDFTGEKTGFVQVGPQKWFFPSTYLRSAKNYYNFEARKEDIWLVTFPRSGTTWTQELVWLLSNNLDYTVAKNTPLTTRFPFFELSICIHEQTKKTILTEISKEKHEVVENIYRPGYEFIKELSSPRFIKTHFPFSLLPPSVMENSCKVIYVARNPKDVAVSYYFHNRKYKSLGYIGNFPKYWDYFEKNLSYWMPYWEHIKEGWSRRNDPNVLFLFYEDMNNNLTDTIKKVATFLNKPITDEQVTKLSTHLHIDNFRKNPSVNLDDLDKLGLSRKGECGFIRKGKLGSWNEEFTPELEERADRWIEMNLQDTDFRFPLKK